MTLATVELEDVVGSALALLGGPRAIENPAAHEDLFRWPIIEWEHEQAVLQTLREGNLSDWGITTQFESEFARYLGVDHALAYPNGTMALQAAMWAVGVRRGDEIICPSVTFWASVLQAFSLGATPVFCDIHPQTLCLDPAGIERHLSPRTRAIMAVHYCGHPADMDTIMEIARRHDLKVIEDVSHAHGTRYRGRMAGTFGDGAGFSMMARKSFAIGEGGMLVTRDRDTYERAVAFSHYERAMSDVHVPDLRPMVAAEGFRTGLPAGGVKGRLNQLASALGRVQLRQYPKRMGEIDQAMKRFWSLLKGTPGLRPHHPEDDTSTMGGWYNPVGHYLPEELEGLPAATFARALEAEGVPGDVGVNFPLHLHPMFNEADIYGDGKPTRIAFSDRDLRQPRGSLPVSEGIAERVCKVPWFKRDRPKEIALYAAAYRKVAMQARRLLKHEA